MSESQVRFISPQSWQSIGIYLKHELQVSQGSVDTVFERNIKHVRYYGKLFEAPGTKFYQKSAEFYRR